LEIAGWATFPTGTREVVVRVGTSFISIDQARRNLDAEIPDGQTLEQTSAACRSAWSEKLNRIRFSGDDAEREGSKWKRVFYSASGRGAARLAIHLTRDHPWPAAAFWHALQYPSETAEGGRYYSGYTDKVHDGESYTAWSIWDTFRAEWPFEILFAPERIGGMVTSLLQDYQQEGWLPMWKNFLETNIMVGPCSETHGQRVLC
jgi:putative alpha-1,2-mannosidase